RHCQSSRHPAGRRADRESGHREFQDRARTPARAQRSDAADHPHDYAQSGGGRLRPLDRTHARRQDYRPHVSAYHTTRAVNPPAVNTVPVLARAARTYPSAAALPDSGDIVADVISPTSAPSAASLTPAAGG